MPPVADIKKPSASVSFVVFLTATALMAWFKLYLFPERYVALAYPLPLLICLWHRDRRLLWSMAATFGVMSALKMFFEMPGRSSEDFEVMQWLLQLTNISAVAVTIHVILYLNGRLRSKNAQLRAANEELAARAEEIARQNTELQAQTEELLQQGEELQQQSEELSRQNEELLQQSDELEHQSEELRATVHALGNANTELKHREKMVETILGSLGAADDELQMLTRVCQALINLIGQEGAVATVLEREGDHLILHTQAGTPRLDGSGRPFDSSFAQVVIEHNRTAFVDDLAKRPDLGLPQPELGTFRSVLATPLRLHGVPIGVVKIYSLQPQKWTAEHFRIIEWVAAQCSLALGILRVKDALARSNLTLEEQVRDRTASLREMVNELEHFSYTITHDMRAPLRAIRGFIGVLDRLLPPARKAEVDDCLTRINNSAARMDKLITDALSYSSTVNNQFSLRPVDAAELLRGIINSYPHFLPPKARITLDGEIPSVLANEAGLTQCFSNLLDNAVKFVEPGRVPEVVIRAEPRADFVRLWFIDNGIGIPKVFWPRAFQMFQRATRVYEGTGVGLALVRKVVEKMGGAVGLDSTPGEGSRFWVDLRCANHPNGDRNGNGAELLIRQNQMQVPSIANGHTPVESGV